MSRQLRRKEGIVVEIRFFFENAGERSIGAGARWGKYGAGIHATALGYIEGVDTPRNGNNFHFVVGDEGSEYEGVAGIVDDGHVDKSLARDLSERFTGYERLVAEEAGDMAGDAHHEASI